MYLCKYDQSKFIFAKNTEYLLTSNILLNRYRDFGLSGVSFSRREISLQIWEVLAFLQQAVSVQHPMPQLEQNWPN